MDTASIKENIRQTFVITIDGPAASGKSTTAKMVAARMHLNHIDTGAMYRAITLKALQSGADLNDGAHLGRLAGEAHIRFSDDPPERRTIYLEDEDVSAAIRSVEVTNSVSTVSAHREVRRAMVRLQRTLASSGGAVLEGRDIGSVVLPSAHLKIYLDASTGERARRRQRDFEAQGIEKDHREIELDIEERDRLDSSREMSPLKIPVGALCIDTTDLSIEEQVNKVIAHAERTIEHLTRLTAASDKNSMVQRIRPHYRIGQFLIRVIFRLLWGLRIVKSDHLDYNENYIFACNHLSYQDPPLVGSTLPREVTFLAKAELFRWRPFAWLIRTYNAIPIKRGMFDREAMEVARTRIVDGGSMLVFPEGTRSKTGELGRPKTGVGYLALNTGVPVVPLYVQGSNRLLPALFRKARLIVAHGRPIRLNIEDRSGLLNKDAYSAYTDMVMEAISALHDAHS